MGETASWFSVIRKLKAHLGEESTLRTKVLWGLGQR